MDVQSMRRGELSVRLQLLLPATAAAVPDSRRGELSMRLQLSLPAIASAVPDSREERKPRSRGRGSTSVGTPSRTRGRRPSLRRGERAEQAPRTGFRRPDGPSPHGRPVHEERRAEREAPALTAGDRVGGAGFERGKETSLSRKGKLDCRYSQPNTRTTSKFEAGRMLQKGVTTTLHRRK